MQPITLPEVDDVLERSEHMFYDYNIFTQVIRVLGAVEKVTGYTKEEFSKIADLEFWTSLVHPDDRAVVRNEQMKFLLKGGSYHGYYRIKQKNGTYVKISDKGFAIPSGKSTLTPERMGGLISIVDNKEDYLLKTWSS